mgnify:CR=1 FL=1
MARGPQPAREAPPTDARPFQYPWRWLAALTAVFVLVHLVYYALGVRFNRGTLVEVMHFLDPDLLQHRLLESLWYLHIQPPLMNLATGLILKVTPEGVWLFQALFLVFGLTLYLCVFVLQLRFGVPRWLAAAFSTLFMASPAFILWEHFLLYTFPCAALLALAAVLLFHVLERTPRAATAGFFIALFLLCGTRSMFHLGYYVLVAGVVLAAVRRYRRRVLVAALIPGLVLFGFYFKNLALFGEFTTCTFVEKNLWIMTVGNMNGAEKVRLVEAGKLSEVSLVNRWASLDAYPPAYRGVPEPFEDVPALSRTHKSTREGVVNYNHYGNIALCNVYGRDARYVLRHYPSAYLLACSMAAWRYFQPSSALPVAPENQRPIRPVIALYQYAACGRLPFALDRYPRFIQRTGTPPYVFLLFGLPALWLFGVGRAVRPRARTGWTRSQRMVVLFMCFNVLMVFALGCALDFLETARYRFMTDAFFVVLLGIGAGTLAGKGAGGQKAPTE